jgi:hypothetical protein
MIYDRQLVMIDLLRNLINDTTWKIKAEYSTNDNDKKVIVVQEQTGPKVVFYGECSPIYNYYQIQVYGTSIEEEKNISLTIQQLIGTNTLIERTKGNVKSTWQVLVKQFTNFQPIEYMDIRRVGYTATMLCIVSKIKEENI